jgi:glycosyltransferase involved in cell wall biosynthesis
LSDGKGGSLRILFIHEVSYQKKPVYEIHEFPELLSLMGHEISFFEFDEGRKFWNKSTRAKEKSIQGRVLSEAKLKLFRPFQLGIPGIDRILVVFSSLFSLSKLIKEDNFDVIVLYAVPTFGSQAVFLAKRRGVPLLFRALDVTHKIRPSMFSPLIKQVERFVYRESEVLSANNSAMEKYTVELSKRKSPTVVHLPPLDLKHFENPVRDIGLRQSLGIHPHEKVIVYMGSFFYFSGLVEVLKEFAKISSVDDNVKLLLLGGGDQFDELLNLSRNLDLTEKVIFTGFISYQELPKYLSLADVAINPLKPVLVSNAAFPHKVLQYLAVGLPVVSTKLDGLVSFFAGSKEVTWGSSPESVFSIAHNNLLETSSLPSPRKTRLAEPLLQQFLPSRAAGAFEKTLLELVGKGKSR